MKIFLTGTPGVGKTTVSKLLAKKLSAKVININELVKEKSLYIGLDEKRNSVIVDLKKLCKEINKIASDKNIWIVEGHLSHLCHSADFVIVLRLHPSHLKKRLEKRGYNKSKIMENVEAEALGVCTHEALSIHGDKVHEIDTTNLSPNDVCNLIVEIINGKKIFKPGKIDFLEDFVREKFKNSNEY